ncbi:MAG: iron-containing alcohol dehydrogenase [Candidatus Aminicenantes bacterium]|nr:iron-containing alcohol dehydrogenase [Candidatus Aminicenantes bacterium]
METLKQQARTLIDEFKGTAYIYGLNCLHRIGPLAAPYGKRILLITSLNQRDSKNYNTITRSLSEAGLEICAETPSARPNSPRQDILRMKEEILLSSPDAVLVASGGSGIDAAKAALVLADLGGDFDDYFGVGKVTERIGKTGKQLRPCIAVQTASGSSAHLSKYSNITDLSTHQKKLIVDDAIIPPVSLFDYSLTISMSPDFTCDGAFDTLAHCLEVYYGAPPAIFPKAEEIALIGIELITAYLKKAVDSPTDSEAREALGLAADLGGYAIMVGGTNGAHLTSFSLVDILSHGRACALLNPYYTVFFAPAIRPHLEKLGELLSRYSLMETPAPTITPLVLGREVAQGLIALSRSVGFPITLKEIPGMTESHIIKALEAAKNPQLEMKLKNMPVPLTAEMVDEYMEPILRAAYTGDFSLIKNMNMRQDHH